MYIHIIYDVNITELFINKSIKFFQCTTNISKNKFKNREISI